jgi:hypothetical protein
VFVVVTDGGQKLGHVVVVKAVSHPAPLALRHNEPQLAQHAELLRDRARIHLDGVGEFVDAQVTVEQRVEQPHPTLRREHAHRLRHL